MTAEVDLRDGSYGYLLMARGCADDHEGLLETHRRLNTLLLND